MIFTCILAVVVTCEYIIIKRELFILGQHEDTIKNLKEQFNFLNEWVITKQENKSMEEYFIAHNYCKVALYGMGKVANTFIYEMNKSKVNILYGIDKAADYTNTDIEVYIPGADLPSVDVLIVINAVEFEKDKDTILKKLNCPYALVKDIIFDL